jgi:hypothetical protein
MFCENHFARWLGGQVDYRKAQSMALFKAQRPSQRLATKMHLVARPIADHASTCTLGGAGK